MELYGLLDNHKLIIANQIEAKEKGYPLVEIEEAYDGSLWEKGYAPSKPIEVMQDEVRQVRNHYLSETDIKMLSDYPITRTEKQYVKDYRTYLRDYTEQEDWYLNNPLDYNSWKDEQKNKTEVVEEESL